MGDGQMAGTMYTGSLFDPLTRTHTIAQNAAVLGEFIANVKTMTGPKQVDLAVPGWAGLISR